MSLRMGSTESEQETGEQVTAGGRARHAKVRCSLDSYPSPAPLFYCLLLYFCPWQNWRRGELNPRPEITRMAASTCVVGVLISTPAAGIDTLRRNPVVSFSPVHQRPNAPASPQFSANVSQASRYAEVA